MQRRMTDISAISSKNNEELKRLGTVIREVKTELMKVERQIQGSKQYDQAETHQRMVFTLRHTVQHQYDEIVTLKQKIDELEAMKIQHEEHLRQLKQVPEQAKRREGVDETLTRPTLRE
uniref:Protein Muted homolog n=1 Tax=Haemonchus contortus TaxID=6289 RepID=A0A7I4YCQ1_HAECO